MHPVICHQCLYIKLVLQIKPNFKFGVQIQAWRTGLQGNSGPMSKAWPYCRSEGPAPKQTPPATTAEPHSPVKRAIAPAAGHLLPEVLSSSASPPHVAARPGGHEPSGQAARMQEAATKPPPQAAAGARKRRAAKGRVVPAKRARRLEPPRVRARLAAAQRAKRGAPSPAGEDEEEVELSSSGAGSPAGSSDASEVPSDAAEQLPPSSQEDEGSDEEFGRRLRPAPSRARGVPLLLCASFLKSASHYFKSCRRQG